MTLNLFAWLRRKVSEAILGGVQDALETLDTPGNDRPALSMPDALAQRLLALPAGAVEASEDVPVTRNGRKSSK